jgi:hypothetical protein
MVTTDKTPDNDEDDDNVYDDEDDDYEVADDIIGSRKEICILREINTAEKNLSYQQFFAQE